MDPKSESFYHLAYLARTDAEGAGTPNHNLKLRELLKEHKSFEALYNYADKNDSKLKPLSLKINHKEGKIYVPRTIEEILEIEKNKLFNPKKENPSLNFKMSTCVDANFPTQLQKYPETTPVIYYLGNLDLTKRDCIAVVGTRARHNPLTDLEKKDAQEALERIVKKNYVIVSGLAITCDTMGHKAGLKNGTVAVLGYPITTHSPLENKNLQDKIAKNHLLISQYPIGISKFLSVKAQEIGLTLVYRNQTTVALSNIGVLVIRTADKGGTQHAISNAIQLGIPLYAMRRNFVPENKWTKIHRWEFPKKDDKELVDEIYKIYSPKYSQTNLPFPNTNLKQ